MCEALKELMKDELEAKKIEGEIEGKSKGENRVNELFGRLAEAGRVDDFARSVKDKEYQNRLFLEFGL